MDHPRPSDPVPPVAARSWLPGSIWANLVRSRLVRLVVLFGFGSFARMLLVSIVPLKAYALLGTSYAVSGAYLLAGCISVATSLMVPRLDGRVGHRVVFLSGTGALALGIALLAFNVPAVFLVGLALHAVGYSTIEIVMSYYALEGFRRDEFLHFEPARTFTGAIACTVAPWLAIMLMSTVPQSVPFMVSVGVLASSCVYFWWLGLGPGISRGRGIRAINPFSHIRHFFAQPRLRLAYVLTVGRSGFWTIYNTFIPIYAVRLGFSPVFAATLVWLSMMWLLAGPFWGFLARRFGTRRVLLPSYLLGGAFMLLGGLTSSWPGLSVGLCFVASLAIGVLDGPGNVLFLRAVKPLQRPNMAAVFATFRDVGQILPQLAFGLILLFADFNAALAAAGLVLMTLAWLCRHIPRRM